MTIPDTKYPCASSSQLPGEAWPLITWKFVLVLTRGLSWKKFSLTLPICHSHSISCNFKLGVLFCFVFFLQVYACHFPFWKDQLPMVELWGYAPRCLVGYKWLQSTSRATCQFSLIFEMCLHVFLVLNPRESFIFCTCIFCICIRVTEPLFITTKNQGKSTCLSIDSYQVGKINHILFTSWHIGEQFK